MHRSADLKLEISNVRSGQRAQQIRKAYNGYAHAGFQGETHKSRRKFLSKQDLKQGPGKAATLEPGMSGKEKGRPDRSGPPFEITSTI